MIIILEGPDNAGKSTLAKMLSKELSLEVIHPGGPPANIADALIRCGEQAMIFQLGEHVSFIYDRVTCISDAIYRGISSYDNVFAVFQADLSHEIAEGNIMLVYCRPPNRVVNDFSCHVTKSHETEAVVEYAKRNFDRIVFEYDELMTRLKPVIYDYTADDAAAKYNYILRAAKK
jgi:hypothetical protein